VAGDRRPQPAAALPAAKGRRGAAEKTREERFLSKGEESNQYGGAHELEVLILWTKN
jgi:hypothetical protein